MRLIKPLYLSDWKYFVIVGKRKVFRNNSQELVSQSETSKLEIFHKRQQAIIRGDWGLSADCLQERSQHNESEGLLGYLYNIFLKGMKIDRCRHKLTILDRSFKWICLIESLPISKFLKFPRIFRKNLVIDVEKIVISSPFLGFGSKAVLRRWCSYQTLGKISMETCIFWKSS